MPRPRFPRALGSRSETLLKFALPILAIAALNACSYVRGAFRVDNAFYFEGELQDVKADDPDNRAVDAERRPINLDTFRFPEVDDAGGTASDTAYKMAVAPGNKAERNRLLNFLIQRSNAVCDEHRGAIMADAALGNTIFSGLTTLLGGTAALVTGATAARVLGGTAAMSSGIQSNFNLEIYREQFAGLIVRGIEKDRADFKAGTIDKGMSDDVDDYPLDRGITDVAVYHQKCSFYSGLMKLTEAIERPTFTPEKLDAALATLTETRKILVGEIDTMLTDPAKDSDIPEVQAAWRTKLVQAQNRLQVIEADMLAKQAIRASLTQ